MVAVRKFNFTNLPQLTAEMVTLQQSLAENFAFKPLGPDFYHGLCELIGSSLKHACHISPLDFRVLGTAELETVLPSSGCLVILGAAPSPSKIIVDLDLVLANFVIERLLGGSGERLGVRRVLTSIEEGILSFVLLQILQYFAAHREADFPKWALTLDDFAAKVEDLSKFTAKETSYMMLGFSIGVGRLVGYVRILLPGSLLTSHFPAAPAQGGNLAPSELRYMRRLAETIIDVPILARAQIATLEVKSTEIANLEAGDIVILENHQLQKTSTGLQGQILIKIGNAQNGYLKAALKSAGEQLYGEITEIVGQEHPLEERMTEEEHSEISEMSEHSELSEPSEASEISEVSEAAAAKVAVPLAELKNKLPTKENAPSALAADAADDDNLAETAGLLRDVEAPVVIELGRVRLNTEQLLRLKRGQILRLSRGPNDPVDLVVHGRVFAKGELVEVDGDLGVRLLQVIKAS